MATRWHDLNPIAMTCDCFTKYLISANFKRKYERTYSTTHITHDTTTHSALSMKAITECLALRHVRPGGEVAEHVAHASSCAFHQSTWYYCEHVPLHTIEYFNSERPRPRLELASSTHKLRANIKMTQSDVICSNWKNETRQSLCTSSGTLPSVCFPAV